MSLSITKRSKNRMLLVEYNGESTIISLEEFKAVLADFEAIYLPTQKYICGPNIELNINVKVV